MDREHLMTFMEFRESRGFSEGNNTDDFVFGKIVDWLDRFAHNYIDFGERGDGLEPYVTFDTESMINDLKEYKDQSGYLSVNGIINWLRTHTQYLNIDDKIEGYQRDMISFDVDTMINDMKADLNLQYDESKAINEGVFGMFANTMKWWPQFSKNPRIANELVKKDKETRRGYFWAKSKNIGALKKAVKCISEYADVYLQQLKMQLTDEAGKDVSSLLNISSYKGSGKKLLDMNQNVINFKNKQLAVKNEMYKKAATTAIEQIPDEKAKEWANSMLAYAELCVIDIILNDDKIKSTTNVDTIENEWDKFKNMRNQVIDNLADEAEKQYQKNVSEMNKPENKLKAIGSIISSFKDNLKKMSKSISPSNYNELKNRLEKITNEINDAQKITDEEELEKKISELVKSKDEIELDIKQAAKSK